MDCAHLLHLQSCMYVGLTLLESILSNPVVIVNAEIQFTVKCHFECWSVEFVQDICNL